MFLLVIVTCLSEEEQWEALLSWGSGPTSWQGTGRPVQGCGHTWRLLVLTHLAAPKAFLKFHSFKYMCSLFPRTSVNKAFCSCSYQAVPCNHVERLSQQHLSETAAEQATTAGGMRSPCICFPLSARPPRIM